MDVKLSDEQQLLRSSIREFAESRLRPHVMEWDEAQAFPRELLTECAELGLMGIQFPEEYGGAAMSAIDYCICIEELALVEPAATGRLPAMYPFRYCVDAGGLLSYGPSLTDLHRRAAVDVDKILRGAKPADLSVEQPTAFELVINLKPAAGLAIGRQESWASAPEDRDAQPVRPFGTFTNSSNPVPASARTSPSLPSWGSIPSGAPPSDRTPRRHFGTRPVHL